MGFLDKAKELAQSAGETLEVATKITKEKAVAAKCATGFHAGDWKNIEGKPLCYFKKTCPDCYKELEKWEHKFEYVGYERENDCSFLQKCCYCQAEKREIRHKYAINNSTCEGAKLCTRCNYEEKLYFHKYEESAENPNILECSKCGVRKAREIAIREMQTSAGEAIKLGISLYVKELKKFTSSPPQNS